MMRTPADRAWLLMRVPDTRLQEAITDAIMEAENAAYEKAAEMAVQYGHISSDLARQKILACKWPERIGSGMDMTDAEVAESF